MKLYLVRHADAVSEDIAGGDDVRWLSARGREAARGLARLLREQRVELDAICHSPLPRAMQTAELLAAGLDFLGGRRGAAGAGAGLPPAARRRGPRRARRARSWWSATSRRCRRCGAWLLGRPSFPSFRTAQCCALENGAPTFTARADIEQVQPSSSNRRDRRPRMPERSPRAWARFLSEDEWREFVIALTSELARRNVAYRIDDGVLWAAWGSEEDEALWLTNLAQLCRAAGIEAFPTSSRRTSTP